MATAETSQPLMTQTSLSCVTEGSATASLPGPPTDFRDRASNGTILADNRAARSLSKRVKDGIPRSSPRADSPPTLRLPPSRFLVLPRLCVNRGTTDARKCPPGVAGHLQAPCARGRFDGTSTIAPAGTQPSTCRRADRWRGRSAYAHTPRGGQLSCQRLRKLASLVFGYRAAQGASLNEGSRQINLTIDLTLCDEHVAHLCH